MLQPYTWRLTFNPINSLINLFELFLWLLELFNMLFLSLTFCIQKIKEDFLPTYDILQCAHFFFAQFINNSL